MRGSHHPCAEFPGLYTRCAHYEGFPPSLPSSRVCALTFLNKRSHLSVLFSCLHAACQ
ncbi:unnamed protein product, partial [Staurois parvus]